MIYKRLILETVRLLTSLYICVVSYLWIQWKIYVIYLMMFNFVIGVEHTSFWFFFVRAEIYTSWVVLSIAVTSYFTVAPPSVVADWLHLVQSPHVEFNVIILLLGLMNILLCYIWEVSYISPYTVNAEMKKRLHQFTEVSWCPYTVQQVSTPLMLLP